MIPEAVYTIYCTVQVYSGFKSRPSFPVTLYCWSVARIWFTLIVCSFIRRVSIVFTNNHRETCCSVVGLGIVSKNGFNFFNMSVTSWYNVQFQYKGSWNTKLKVSVLKLQIVYREMNPGWDLPVYRGVKSVAKCVPGQLACLLYEGCSIIYLPKQEKRQWVDWNTSVHVGSCLEVSHMQPQFSAILTVRVTACQVKLCVRFLRNCSIWSKDQL